MQRDTDPEAEQKQVVFVANYADRPDIDNGLEAVAPGQGLEVAHHQAPEVAPYHDGLEAVSNEQWPYRADINEDVASLASRRKFWSRKRIWWSVGAGLLAIIVIVLGTVLGITLSKKSDSPTQSASTSTSTASSGSSSSKAAPTSIATLSPLAATTWGLDNGDYGIKVIYQDATGHLQDSTYSSATSNWTKVSNFTTARQGTPLGMTTFLNGDPQVELFHVDENDLLSEWNWNIKNRTGARGSLNGFNFPVSTNSRMTTYWPFVLVQGDDLGLQQYEFDNGWRALNTTSPTLQAENGTSLSLVNFGPIVDELSILYQSGTNLTEYVEASTSAKTVTPISSSGTSKPVLMTAFSFNSSSTSSPWNCVLYQDDKSDIQMMVQNGTWNGPQKFDAFKGADPGTSIACTSLNSHFSGLSAEGIATPRCYFQVSGSLKEVQLVRDAEDWKIIGDVPTE